MSAPDVMHTVANDVKSCLEMFGGARYMGRLDALIEYEARVNKRYKKVRVTERQLFLLSEHSCTSFVRNPDMCGW